LSFHDLPRRQDSTHLNDEETMLVETVRAFIDRDVKPTVREAEHDNEYPAAWIEQMKRIGIYGLAISGLATGDVGMVDCDGWVRITGRIKDMINRGGEKFSAREIENALCDHPAIEAAAVLGVPEQRLGEQVVAYVTTRPGQCYPGFSAIIDYLQQRRMAPQKYPVTITVLEDAVPAMVVTRPACSGMALRDAGVRSLA
jgi:acyl-CoA synthetase (AMP-forming)/AMP-acid ligase II